MKNLLLLLLLLLAGLHLKAQTITPPAAKPVFKPVFEKTYLHTDRDVYTQGDTLWFKAYLVNAQNDKPSISSGNLYVELIAPDSGKIINREIIRLNNGLGNGDMEITDSLPAGKYKLRAYTNWMRNFGDNFTFSKTITILNTGTATATAAGITAPVKPALIKGKVNKSPAINTVAQTTVRFYPEGGSLVEGISSIVGVKAGDGYGKGFPASGVVLSSAGDTISRFSCDALGMGLFAMLPINGLTYHAVVNKIAYNLPKALTKGLALQVKQTDTIINVAISSSVNPATAAIKPRYTLEIKHTGQAFINHPVTMEAQQTAVKISAASLPEGISAITLYDEQNKPNCERLVYIHHPGMEKTTVTPDKKTYRPKEPATIQINTGPGVANLSMAVVDAAIAPARADDIVSYLMLGSELRGHVEQASRYFDPANADRFKQLDLLMLTQGWRDFVWRRLADTAIRISYAAENSIVIAGKVRDENRNKVMPNLHVTLFAGAAKGNKLFSATSDSSGRFNFQNVMLYGNQTVRLSTVNDKGAKKGAITVDTLLPLPFKAQLIKVTAADAANDSAAIAAIAKNAAQIKASKVAGITRLKEVKVTERKNKTIVLRDNNAYTPFGTNQLLTITPQDYQYKTLSWFLLQKGKGAVQSKQGMGVDFIVDGHHTPPRLIINGEDPYRVDKNLYYSMPIDKFKSVQIKEVAQVGGGLKYLVYLNMKDDYLTDNPGTLTTGVTGYYEARTFYKPFPTTRPTIADFRTTIHWEPNIKTDINGKATVSFYNAVPQTNVRIIVQGITPDGKPITAVTGYLIK